MTNSAAISSYKKMIKQSGNIIITKIDNRKVYGMFPQPKILKSFKVFQIFEQEIVFIQKAVKNERVEFIACGKRRRMY